MGSIDVYSYEPSGGLIENLTDEEKTELQSYIETERQAAEKRSRVYYAKSAASRIVEVADTIKAGDFEPSEAWAADTWAAIEALTKAMRKAGYPKLRKAPQKAADAPMPGQAGLPFGDAPETPESAS
nr:hypothetical protein [Klebsiella pneumoniae]ALU64984.1 hypothetical protein [Klebsiella pneumoniae]